jgi:competence protein ComEA
MNKHSQKLSGILAVAIVLGLVAPLAAAAAPAGVVNVNTATAEQLQLLPRIGASVAQRVIEYRKENGKFGTLDDLMLVRGIGESTFAQLKPYVSLTGETTLKEKVKPTRSTGRTAAAAAKPSQGAPAKPQG